MDCKTDMQDHVNKPVVTFASSSNRNNQSSLLCAVNIMYTGEGVLNIVLLYEKEEN